MTVTGLLLLVFVGLPLAGSVLVFVATLIVHAVMAVAGSYDREGADE